MSRVQLALNVADINAIIEFYCKLFAARRPRAGPGTPTSPLSTRPSSSSSSRTAGSRPRCGGSAQPSRCRGGDP